MTLLAEDDFVNESNLITKADTFVSIPSACLKMFCFFRLFSSLIVSTCCI